MGFSVAEGLKLNSKVSDKAQGKEGTYYWRAAIENVKSSIALPLSLKVAGGTYIAILFSYMYHHSKDMSGSIQLKLKVP